MLKLNCQQKAFQPFIYCDGGSGGGDHHHHHQTFIGLFGVIFL